MSHKYGENNYGESTYGGHLNASVTLTGVLATFSLGTLVVSANIFLANGNNILGASIRSNGFSCSVGTLFSVKIPA